MDLQMRRSDSSLSIVIPKKKVADLLSTPVKSALWVGPDSLPRFASQFDDLMNKAGEAAAEIAQKISVRIV